MTIIKITSICLLLIASLGSCRKWIDVKPSDRLADEQLFSSREGYLSALNGVYVELTKPEVYGENMTMTTLDVLGQYYYMSASTHQFYQFATFNYTGATARTVFDNMWKKSYELIVNCNIIIDKCGESSNPLLPAPYFGIVKGEALALRAMLHFDMLRLFGPIWSEENKDVPCIPYNKAPRPEVTPLLGSAAVMQHVIDDLTAAVALLKDADPIITEGVRHEASPAGINDFYYRQYRLNYYAAKALLARAYLWKQDTGNALREAQEILAAVMDPAHPVFKLGVLNPAAIPADYDHMMMQEVLFALYTVNRQNIFNAFFSPDQLATHRLSFNNNDDNQSRKNALYDDQNDYRLKAWITQNTASGSFLTHIKFNVGANTPAPNMIPLIRLSEVILIAAECSPTLAEGTAYLNMLRTGMNCVSVAPASSAQLKDYITLEFRKAVIGEGQMFFYYKRNAFTTVPNHASVSGTKQMQLSNYTVPLPISEISVRGN